MKNINKMTNGILYVYNKRAECPPDTVMRIMLTRYFTHYSVLHTLIFYFIRPLDRPSVLATKYECL